MNWHGLIDETALAGILPPVYAHFGKPISEGLAIFLEGLPARLQARILAQQAALPLTAGLEQRLGLLARNCPVLQKIGQILARDQRLPAELRSHLRPLEALPPRILGKTVRRLVIRELGPLDSLGIELAPRALAEASVAVVVPFEVRDAAGGSTARSAGRSAGQGGPRHGVLKVLKPGIEEQLEVELGLLEQVGAHLDGRCDELQIPHLDYQESFELARAKLGEEVLLRGEQQKLAAAREFYASNPRVQIPAVMDYCTPRVTAMERVWGRNVADRKLQPIAAREKLARLIVDALIAQPMLTSRQEAVFHSDPHAGNLMLTTDGRLAILDWSLVGRLRATDRDAIVQLMLAAVALDAGRMVTILQAMAARGRVDHEALSAVVGRHLARLRWGQPPGLTWLTGLLDEAVHDAGLRLDANLMLFRKSLFTLQGVVAEVGAAPATFDQVVARALLKHLALEWPQRWLAAPNCREFATRLSNADLAQAILGYPSSLVRLWIGYGLDLSDACRRALTPATPRRGT
jgi:ubiquinone biosynthesis protein